MKEHVLRRTAVLPKPLPEVFSFFEDAYNLERITPSFVGFKILTPRPIDMGKGTLIDYRIRICGVPMNWQTRIEEYVKNEYFVDTQIKGPYALWHHTHTFSADGDKTLMDDVVRYALPLQPLGEIAHPLFVRAMVNRIFDYRAEAMLEIFS